MNLEPARLELENAIVHTWPQIAASDTRLLLAVSGGADSVSLFRASLRLSADPGILAIGHFNHGWRGAASDRDAGFVKELATRHGIDCHIGVQAASDSESLRSEESARLARYQFLEKTAYKIGARYVLTAHTADDRVETLLHNLFRGTGLAGARSIELTRPLGAELILVRPMLQCARSAVLTYLSALGQDYCEDESNSDESYRRNFLRHRLLPMIRRVYGDATDQRLLAFGDIAGEMDQLLGGQAQDYIEQTERLRDQLRAMPKHPGNQACEIVFPSDCVLPVAWPVLRAALAIHWTACGWSLGHMSHAHWTQIREVHQSVKKPRTAESSKFTVHANLPGNLQLTSCDGWLVVREVPSSRA